MNALRFRMHKRIPKHLLISFLVGLLLTFVLESGRASDEPAQAALVDRLVQRLKAGRDIASLMAARFQFVYKADNRCEGSTSGAKGALLAARVDQPIRLLVTNDGQAWACPTRAPSTAEIEFSLKARLLNWDRFEATRDSNKPGVVYLEGAGQSDYLIIRLGKTGGAPAIERIEYRSEDPG